MSETITAKVVRAKPNTVWLFRKPDTMWSILKTDQGICKGVIGFEPQEGDLLQLEGKWQTSKFNGEQEFCFTSATIEVPTDPRALLHYAASITKGIGASTEADIWCKYGTDWPLNPELEGITGISDSTRWHWRDTIERLKNQKYQAKTIAFLLAHGCTLNLATAAWDRWADEAMPKVERNCFCLTELPNYGFSHVDDMIREHFDIGDEDPRRLDACVIYFMKQQVDSGDTLIDWERVRIPVVKYIPSAKERFDLSVKRLEEKGLVTRVEDALGVDIYLSLTRNYEDEVQIWEWICEH